MWCEIIERMFPQNEIKSAFHMRAVVIAGIILVSCGFAAGVFESQPSSAGGVPAPAGPDAALRSPVGKAWSVIEKKPVPASVPPSTPIAPPTQEINQKRFYNRKTPRPTSSQMS